MVLHNDYEACLRYLETVEEEMIIPERSAARPRLGLIEKGVPVEYSHVDDEVSSADFSFGENESSDDQDCGSPKESIFSMGSASDVPKLRLQDDDDDDLDMYLGELHDVVIQEITNVITYTRATPRLRIRR